MKLRSFNISSNPFPFRLIASVSTIESPFQLDVGEMGDRSSPYDDKSTGVLFDPFIPPPAAPSLAFRAKVGRPGVGVTRDALRERGLWESEEEVGVGR